jgi:hypothetical protein
VIEHVSIGGAVDAVDAVEADEGHVEVMVERTRWGLGIWRERRELCCEGFVAGEEIAAGSLRDFVEGFVFLLRSSGQLVEVAGGIWGGIYLHFEAALFVFLFQRLLAAVPLIGMLLNSRRGVHRSGAGRM